MKPIKIRITALLLTLAVVLCLASCSREAELTPEQELDKGLALITGEAGKLTDYCITLSADEGKVILSGTQDGTHGSLDLRIEKKNQSPFVCKDIVRMNDNALFLSVSAFMALSEYSGTPLLSDRAVSGYEGLYIKLPQSDKTKAMDDASKAIASALRQAHLAAMEGNELDGTYTYSAKDGRTFVSTLVESLRPSQDVLAKATNDIRDKLLAVLNPIIESLSTTQEGYPSTEINEILDGIKDESFGDTLVSSIFALYDEKEGEGVTDVPQDETIAPEGDFGLQETFAFKTVDKKDEYSHILTVRDKDGNELFKAEFEAKELPADKDYAEKQRLSEDSYVTAEVFLTAMLFSEANLTNISEVDDFPYDSECTPTSLILSQSTPLYDETKTYTVGKGGVTGLTAEYRTKELYIHEALVHKLTSDGYSLNTDDSRLLKEGVAAGYIKVTSTEDTELPAEYSTARTPEELLQLMTENLYR